MLTHFEFNVKLYWSLSDDITVYVVQRTAIT
jgi:hypothetical protein